MRTNLAKFVLDRVDEERSRIVSYLLRNGTWDDNMTGPELRRLLDNVLENIHREK